MKHEFRFPDIGEGIAEGTLTKWLVSKGDKVEEGQSLVEVETDKVTTEIPSSKPGIVADLKFDEGDVINVGDVFIVLDLEGYEDDIPEIDEEDEKEEVEEEETAGVVGEIMVSSDEIASSDEAVTSTEKKETEKKKVLATPVARKLAKDLGVNIQTVEGTGPQGRVMKEDIEQAAKEPDRKSVV